MQHRGYNRLLKWTWDLEALRHGTSRHGDIGPRGTATNMENKQTKGSGQWPPKQVGNLGRQHRVDPLCHQPASSTTCNVHILHIEHYIWHHPLHLICIALWMSAICTSHVDTKCASSAHCYCMRVLEILQKRTAVRWDTVAVVLHQRFSTGTVAMVIVVDTVAMQRCPGVQCPLPPPSSPHTICLQTFTNHSPDRNYKLQGNTCAAYLTLHCIVHPVLMQFTVKS